MWVITKTGFVSAVQHRDDPDLLMVRARVSADLHDLMEFCKPTTPDLVDTLDSDYRYRITVTKAHFAAWLVVQVMTELDYTSHAKEAMVAGDPDVNRRGRRYDAYLQCWGALSDLQPTPPYSETRAM